VTNNVDNVLLILRSRYVRQTGSGRTVLYTIVLQSCSH